MLLITDVYSVVSNAIHVACCANRARVTAALSCLYHISLALHRSSIEPADRCKAAVCSYGNSSMELQLAVNEEHAGFFVTHYADERSWQAAFRAAVSSSSSDSSSSAGATEVEAVGLVQDLILLLHQVGSRQHYHVQPYRVLYDSMRTLVKLVKLSLKLVLH
jgi:hypothetical protein